MLKPDDHKDHKHIYFFMNNTVMSMKITFGFSLITTLVTFVFKSFVNTLFMSLNATVLCSMIITLITFVFGSFMDTTFMCPEVTLCWSLIITMITILFYLFMNNTVISLNRYYICCSLITTLVPFVFNTPWILRLCE